MSPTIIKMPRGLPDSATDRAHREHESARRWMAAAGVSKHVRKVISHVNRETLCRIYAHDAWFFLRNLELLTRTRVRFAPAALDRLCAEFRLFWRVLPLPVLRYAITRIDTCMENPDEDEREGELSNLFRKLSEIQYWLDAGSVPHILSNQQAYWSWCTKAAAAWVESEQAQTGIQVSIPYSWNSVLPETDLCLFVARPLVDSEACGRKAREYEICLGHSRYVLNAMADRARYFEFLRKPDFIPAAIVELVRQGDAWIVGEVAGPSNTRNLLAEAQAASLAQMYSEAYQACVDEENENSITR